MASVIKVTSVIKFFIRAISDNTLHFPLFLLQKDHTIIRNDIFFLKRLTFFLLFYFTFRKSQGDVLVRLVLIKRFQKGGGEMRKKIPKMLHISH